MLSPPVKTSLCIINCIFYEKDLIVIIQIFITDDRESNLDQMSVYKLQFDNGFIFTPECMHVCTV